MSQEPVKAWVTIGIIIATLIAGDVLFRNLFPGVLGAMLIFSSSAEFLVPVRYVLTDRHAAMTYGWTRMEIEWKNVRRIITTEEGIRLSPLEKAGRMDAFRGVPLKLDTATANKAMQIIHKQTGL